MLYENGRGRVLGFGFTAQPEGKTVAWWMLFANTQDCGLANAIRDFAVLQGLAAERIADIPDDGTVAYEIAAADLELPSAETLAARFEGPQVLPDPPRQAASGATGWRDDDELTRAEAASRLGCTERYLRTLSERGDVRVKRKSRKLHRYVWGWLREDWAKLGQQG